MVGRPGADESATADSGVAAHDAATVARTAAKRILRCMRVPPRDGARPMARHYHRQSHAVHRAEGPVADGHRPPRKSRCGCRSGGGATVVVIESPYARLTIPPPSDRGRLTMATKSTQPIPEGMHTLSPHIVCAGAAKAIDFYKAAFNA